MLENWCYDTESLKILSSHFETGKPISDEMIDRIIKAKNVNAAVMNLRQLFFGIFDMTIHTSEGNDEECWYPMLPLLTPPFVCVTQYAKTNIWIAPRCTMIYAKKSRWWMLPR